MNVKDILTMPIVFGGSYLSTRGGGGRDRRRGEYGEAAFDDANNDITIPLRRRTDLGGGDGGGVKLWHILVGQVTVFCMLLGAHYTLVQRTLGESREQMRGEIAVMRNEIALAQTKLELTLTAQGRGDSLQDQHLLEIDKKLSEIENAIMLLKERQAVIRQKLGLHSDGEAR